MEIEEFNKKFKVETYLEPVYKSPETLWVHCASPKGIKEQTLMLINKQGMDWKLLELSKSFTLRTNVDGLVLKIINVT